MKVIFRKWESGDIIALFPTLIDTKKYRINSYEHKGQHSDADYDDVMSHTVSATEDEYSDIIKELVLAGYKNLKVVHKCRPIFFNDPQKEIIRFLKKGGFFKFKDSKKAPVWVRGDYVRQLKKYEVYKYDDTNHSISVSGNKVVFIDLPF